MVTLCSFCCYKEHWANKTFKTNHTSLNLTYILRLNVKGNRKYSNHFNSTPSNNDVNLNIVLLAKITSVINFSIEIYAVGKFDFELFSTVKIGFNMCALFLRNVCKPILMLNFLEQT